MAERTFFSVNAPYEVGVPSNWASWTLRWRGYAIKQVDEEGGLVALDSSAIATMGD